MTKTKMKLMFSLFYFTVENIRMNFLILSFKTLQATKETKRVREYEEGLLKNYRHYLEFMEALVKGKTPKSKNKKVRQPNGVQIPASAMQVITTLTLCHCILV